MVRIYYRKQHSILTKIECSYKLVTAGEGSVRVKPTLSGIFGFYAGSDLISFVRDGMERVRPSCTDY